MCFPGLLLRDCLWLQGAAPAVDPGAELTRQTSTSAAPALAALQRLETGALPPTTVEAIRNTLNPEEMRMLQRRMPALFGKPGEQRSNSTSGLSRLFSKPPSQSAVACDM